MRWRWAPGVSNGTHVPPAEPVPQAAATDTVCDVESAPEPDETPPVELVRRDLARHWREGRRAL